MSPDPLLNVVSKGFDEKSELNPAGTVTLRLSLSDETGKSNKIVLFAPAADLRVGTPGGAIDPKGGETVGPVCSIDVNMQEGVKFAISKVGPLTPCPP